MRQDTPCGTCYASQELYAHETRIYKLSICANNHGYIVFYFHAYLQLLNWCHIYTFAYLRQPHEYKCVQKRLKSLKGA